MPTPTENLGLKKHAYQEQGWHTGLNESLDILDAEVQALRAGKAGSVHRHPATEVDGLLEAFASKADVGHHHPVGQVVGLPEALAAIQAALALKADLGADGKLPSTLLPSLALVNTWPVSSADEMLAIEGNPGDFALRLDLPPDSRAYILAQLPAADPLNWIRVETPEAPHTVDQIVGLAEALATKADKAARVTRTYTTGLLADGAQEQGAFSLAKVAGLLKVSTSAPARVRLYLTDSQRGADASRPVSQDPAGDHGLVLEVVTTPSLLTINLAPIPTWASPDDLATAYLTVDNLSGGALAVSVAFTLLPLEV